jgi:hypothetical protein
VSFTPMPPPRHGRNQPVRKCQHCERDIELTADGRWVDREEIGVCIVTLAPTLREPGGYVFHTPMPVIT